MTTVPEKYQPDHAGTAKIHTDQHNDRIRCNVPVGVITHLDATPGDRLAVIETSAGIELARAPVDADVIGTVPVRQTANRPSGTRQARLRGRMLDGFASGGDTLRFEYAGPDRIRVVKEGSA